MEVVCSSVVEGVGGGVGRWWQAGVVSTAYTRHVAALQGEGAAKQRR